MLLKLEHKIFWLRTQQAFDFNDNMTIVTFGSSLTTIRQIAFQNNLLTNIVLTQRLKTIEHKTFKGNQLTNITIPKNITTIKGIAFDGNPLVKVTSLNQAPPSITNKSKAILNCHVNS